MRKLDVYEAKLKPRLTDEFLETLSEAARTCGHSVDFPATEEFVRWCYAVAEQPVPDLSPYYQAFNVDDDGERDIHDNWGDEDAE